jgi:hypothetical protein
MPYDPRQMQAIGRMGINMMASQPSPFDRNTPGKTPQWWEQPLPQRKDQPADQDADSSQAPDSPKQPPSLMDMMMTLGRMTPKDYAKAQSGMGPGQPQGLGMVSPWAYLGGLSGWGGGAK